MRPQQQSKGWERSQEIPSRYIERKRGLRRSSRPQKLTSSATQFVSPNEKGGVLRFVTAGSGQDVKKSCSPSIRRPAPRDWIHEQSRHDNEMTCNNCCTSTNDQAKRRTEPRTLSSTTQCSSWSGNNNLGSVARHDATPKRCGGVPSRQRRNPLPCKKRQSSNRQRLRETCRRQDELIEDAPVQSIIIDKIPKMVSVSMEPDDTTSDISLEGLWYLDVFDDRTLTPHPSYEIDCHDARPNERDFHYLYQSSLRLQDRSMKVPHEQNCQSGKVKGNYHGNVTRSCGNGDGDDDSAGLFTALWGICQGLSRFFVSDGSDDLTMTTSTEKFTFLPHFYDYDKEEDEARHFLNERDDWEDRGERSTPRDVMNLMRRGGNMVEEKKKPTASELALFCKFDSFNQDRFA